jgi:SAM-dependent methyltransferase
VQTSSIIESTAEPIPALFEVSREYQFDPNATELGHTSATERLLYCAITEAAQSHFRVVQRPLVILDICAASGGCANEVLKTVPCNSLCLVDNEPLMCEAARVKQWPAEQVSVFKADAVTWTSCHRFDLILMNSAYHHIEDERKAAFLENMASHLKSDGRILVGEHFLPFYRPGDLKSYRHSVVQFYSARIHELAAKGDTQEVIDVIRQTGRYCWQRDYEFQVSMDVFQTHVHAADLQNCAHQRVWPSGSQILPEESGSFLIQLRGSQLNNAHTSR